MKKFALIFLIGSFFTTFLYMGCENNYPDSIWSPDYNSKPTPVITDIDPDVSYSGIGIITITGQNFSSNIKENGVFFNGNPGKVITATTTELTVQVPAIIADSILIQINVTGAFLFGEYGNQAGHVPFKLEDATVKYMAIDATVSISGLACDMNENIYTNLSTPRGIIQITNPDSLFLPQYSSSPTSIVYGMKWGPGGYLYFVRKNKNMYRILPGGNGYEIFARVSENMYDLDFDENGNILVAGKDGLIFSIKPTADTATVANYGEDYDLLLLRVYSGYLYSYQEYTGSDTLVVQRGILRNQILDANGTLGSNELMFDWDTYAGRFGPDIKAMVVDENGKFYLGNDYKGNDKNEAITKLDINIGIAEPLYPAILNAGAYNLVWGNTNYLYIHRFYAEGIGDTYTETRELLRLAMPVNSAPYYGRQ